MPVNLVTTQRDEKLWSLAKQQASKQGREEDYAYIVGIFKKMKGDQSVAKSKSAAVVTLQQMCAQTQGVLNSMKKTQAAQAAQAASYEAAVGSIGYKHPPRPHETVPVPVRRIHAFTSPVSLRDYEEPVARTVTSVDKEAKELWNR